MKAGWVEKKLDEISENFDHQRIPIAKNLRNNGIYPYYGASGIVDYVNKYIFDGEFLLISEDGANLLARTTPIAFSVSGKFWVNNHAHILRFQKISTQHFIEYFFAAKKIDKYITGAAQPKLNQKMLYSIPIPVPPLPEQERIVALLDSAFENIAEAKSHAEKNLANAKELFASELNAIFTNKGAGWVEKKLGEVCKVIGGGTPSKECAEYYNGDIPWATVRDMKNDVLELTEHQISKEAIKKSSTNIISKNSIIIATRVGLGKVCILKQDTAINQDLKGILPNKTLNRLFIFWWLKSISKIIIKNGTGATVQGVKVNFIKNIKIPLPPLPEQERIVARLDALSADCKALENIYIQKLALYEELKQSLLNKAFNGEL